MIDFKKELVGKSTGFRSINYTWRDVALYALAVGADKDDLQYTYERDMKTLPSFGVVPVWAALNVVPKINIPAPASALIEQYIGDDLSPLHFGHALKIYKPIYPLKGTLNYNDKVLDVYDKGPDKGVVLLTECKVYDEGGNHLCTNYSKTLYSRGGGFGGAEMPKSTITIPDRDPDYILEDYISPVQNLLYRLTGDTNYIHVDPKRAVELGQERVIMQGLCSFGFVTRLAIKQLIPGMPERMTGISAQMRNKLLPDTHVALQLWKDGETRALFRFVDTDNNKNVLDRGVFEWK